MKEKKRATASLGPLEVATSLGGRDLVWLDVRSRPGKGRRDLAELQQVGLDVATWMAAREVATWRCDVAEMGLNWVDVATSF